MDKEKIHLEDYMKLIKRARKLKNDDNEDFKIAVLGAYSTQYFVMVLRYLLLEEGINASIYEGAYNSIIQETLDSFSKLYSFKPDVVIIMNYHEEIKVLPQLLASEEEVKKSIDITVKHYKMIWDKLSSMIPGCRILQTNYVIPSLKSLGNLECNYIFSKSTFFKMLNLELMKNRPINVNFVDMDGLASEVGKRNWFDYTSYFLNKTAIKLDYIGLAADMFVKEIKALRGQVNKCLVLDLDNTLWGGVVSETGYDGINLDPNNAVGESYRFFQKYIIELKNRGVILAVCSKNDIEIAKEPFIKNENMLLKLQDISCFKANWQDKAANLKEISDKLNIGLDSLVFFDDNIVERELISACLKEVTVIDVPKDSAEYALALDKSHAFEWLQLTKEDLGRSSSYLNSSKREELMKEFKDYDEYLKSLNMAVEIEELQENNISRFVQLINKSNQFNLRTKRYSEDIILKLLDDKNTKCLAVKFKDKFESYGIISCVILKKIDEYCFIDTWLMSCRVIKRNVELAVYNSIVEEALKLNCNKILGEYIETKKNNLVRNLYIDLGFQEIKDNIIDREGTLFVKTDLKKIDRDIYIEELK